MKSLSNLIAKIKKHMFSSEVAASVAVSSVVDETEETLIKVIAEQIPGAVL